MKRPWEDRGKGYLDDDPQVPEEGPDADDGDLPENNHQLPSIIRCTPTSSSSSVGSRSTGSSTSVGSASR